MIQVGTRPALQKAYKGKKNADGTPPRLPLSFCPRFP
jgi:hypothetical protein